MSVQSEITRIEAAKTAIGTAIAGKGVAVPSGTKLDGMAALIDGIEAGGEDVSAETAEYTSLLTDLETAIDALPEAGSGGGSIDTCTVQITLASGTISAWIGTAFREGSIQAESSGSYDSSLNRKTLILENIVCGSGLMFTVSDMRIPVETITGDGVLLFMYGGQYYIQAPENAGATMTIYISDNF